MSREGWSPPMISPDIETRRRTSFERRSFVPVFIRRAWKREQNTGAARGGSPFIRRNLVISFLEMSLLPPFRVSLLSSLSPSLCASQSLLLLTCTHVRTQPLQQPPRCVEIGAGEYSVHVYVWSIRRFAYVFVQVSAPSSRVAHPILNSSCNW